MRAALFLNTSKTHFYLKKTISVIYAATDNTLGEQNPLMVRTTCFSTPVLPAKKHLVPIKKMLFFSGTIWTCHIL